MASTVEYVGAHELPCTGGSDVVFTASRLMVERAAEGGWSGPCRFRFELLGSGQWQLVVAEIDSE